MKNVLLSGDRKQESKVLIIPRVVFNALSPLDQLAARALEKVGTVKIVEQDDLSVHG